MSITHINSYYFPGMTIPPRRLSQKNDDESIWKSQVIVHLEAHAPFVIFTGGHEFLPLDA